MTGTRDPFYAVGLIWCTTHRAETWAVDAVWIDTDLILATFPADCCGRREHTRVVVPSTLTPMTDRCEGITAAGTRCRNWPRHDSGRCHQHQQADREDAT